MQVGLHSTTFHLPTLRSLALPDPLRTGAYRLEIISDKRLREEGLATRD